MITEEDEAAPEDGGEVGQAKAPESPRAVQPLPPPSPLSLHPRGPLRRTPSLSKRESLMSINRQVSQTCSVLRYATIHVFSRSSCSVDSDWSDEELQELEKILGDIQERSDAAQTAADEEGDPVERRARAVERWSKVRQLFSHLSPESNL